LFLVGGPAYSGTTLLALLLNQADLVCLDEPDFHDPAQSDRGIPVLQGLFPEVAFPVRPEGELSCREAIALAQRCEEAIHPRRLGIKTCNWLFIDHARIFRELGYPVIAIIRDVRDALVRPLPPYVTERGLSDRYRLIWANRSLYDVMVRYETLVTRPGEVMAQVGAVLGVELQARQWATEQVPATMVKTGPRHEMLRLGEVSASRVGIHKERPDQVPAHAEETARLMGYR
jgi:hypothetical protein